MIHFTSDTHFGHKNVIKYCARPFESVEDMDETLIKNWNAKVCKHDEVWHLGDIAFSNPNRRRDILSRLNGTIYLVPGNHDHSLTKLPDNVKIKSEYFETTFAGRHFVLCHFPIESWHRMSYGAIHLHGHSHGASRQVDNRFDVGVDVWNMAPVTIGEILHKAKTEVARPDRREM